MLNCGIKGMDTSIIMISCYYKKKSMVEGLPVIKNDHIECVACALGKQHRNEFPNHEEKRQTKLLELIHTDVCGPM